MPKSSFRLLRRAFAGSSALLLACSFSTGLSAQTTAMSPDSVRQANSQLASEAESSLPLTTQARTMLAARHAALVQSFLSSPATARSLALDAPIRAALLKKNPAYAAMIEQEMTLTGQLVAAVGDNLKARTSQKLYFVHSTTRDTSIAFAKVPANLAALEGHQVTVAGLGFPDAVAVESAHAATPSESAAQLAATQAAVHANTVAAAQPTFLGPGITTAPPATIMTTGPQNAAVIIVNFPDTPATANNPASSSPLILQAPYGTQDYWNQMLNPGRVPNLSDYLAETSYGKESLSADVYGPITLPKSSTCAQGGDIVTAAIQALAATGVNVNNYNRFFIPFPTTSCTYDGLGVSPLTAGNGINHEYTWLLLSFFPTETSGTDAANIAYKFLVTTHEFGHNMGINHSNTLDFGPITLGPIDFVAANPGTVDPNNPSHPATASVHTDSVSPSASAAATTPVSGINLEYGDPYPIMAGLGYTPYNAEHRYDVLNWIDSGSEQDVTSSGSFTIAPAENTTGLRALHVLRDATSDSWMWVEFHQPNSTYTNFGLPLLPSDQTLLSGAELLYSTGTLDPGHTYLLDTTPTAKPNNFDDATLKNGQSWTDPYSLLTITTAASQSSSALGVTVSYDTACAAPTLSSSNLLNGAGTSMVTVTAAAGCSWSTSSNTPWITFTTPTSGTGSGTVGFSYTANATTFQRSGYITTARQSLPIVQQGTAVNIVSVTPAGSAVAPGTFTPIAFNLNNAGGDGVNSGFLFNIGGISPLTADKSCTINVQANGDGTFLLYDVFGNSGTFTVPGTGTGTIDACTFDLSKSTFTSSGSSATLTLVTSFPAAFYGNHPIVAGNDFDHTTNVLGYVQVNTPPVVVYSDTTALSAVPSTITTAQSTTLKATVTPTVSDGTAPALSGTVTFLLSGNSIGSCPLVGGTCSISVAGSALPLGSNSITASYPATGVYPASVSTAATVTVSNAFTSQTITFGALPGVTYGVPPITLTAKASSGLPVTYTVTGPATVSGSTLMITGSGSVTVTANQAGNTSYSAATPVQQSLTVAKATLTITADNLSRVFGAANPTLTYQIAGYVNGDPTAVVNGSATLSTTATSTSPVGGYPISFSTQALTATNYNFTYVNGTLTVTPASQTITFGALANTSYPTAPITLTATASLGLAVSYTVSGPASVSGSTLTVTGAGQITVTAMQSGNGNYSGATPVQQSFTATAGVVAGTTVLSETVTLTSLANGNYQATVKITNSGTGTAQNVTMTTSVLGAANTLQALPAALGNIAPGGSIMTVFTFPSSAGAHGGASVLKLGGTYTGGNFAGSIRVTLPPSAS